MKTKIYIIKEESGLGGDQGQTWENVVGVFVGPDGLDLRALYSEYTDWWGARHEEIKNIKKGRVFRLPKGCVRIGKPGRRKRFRMRSFPEWLVADKGLKAVEYDEYLM